MINRVGGETIRYIIRAYDRSFVYGVRTCRVLKP